MGNFLEFDVKYPEQLHKHHNNLPFLPERARFNKCEKLMCNLKNERNMLYIYEI